MKKSFTNQQLINLSSIIIVSGIINTPWDLYTKQIEIIILNYALNYLSIIMKRT